MKTNLGKTKEEIVFELLLSLNKGDTFDYNYRVSVAEKQYEQLVSRGIVKEFEE